jgi:hypothetical protein
MDKMIQIIFKKTTIARRHRLVNIQDTRMPIAAVWCIASAGKLSLFLFSLVQDFCITIVLISMARCVCTVKVPGHSNGSIKVRILFHFIPFHVYFWLDSCTALLTVLEYLYEDSLLEYLYSYKQVRTPCYYIRNICRYLYITS